MSDGLPDPWWRPDEVSRRQLLDELLVEMPPGHPLHGRVVEVANRCGACDQVLASLDDGSFALVHLTWSGRSEAPPWPTSTVTGGFVATEVAQAEHSKSHL